MSRRNRARCTKCDTIIESKHRHDFVSCKCGKVFVDGGNDYCRLGFDVPESIVLLDDDGTERPLREPQVVQPSPVSASAGADSDSSNLTRPTAAGDQRAFCEECGAYTDAHGFAIPWAANDIIAERDATIAQLRAALTVHQEEIGRLLLEVKAKNAELNAAANGLKQAHYDIGAVRVDGSAPQHLNYLTASDAARTAAATEGGV